MPVKESFELVPRDQVHAVIQINMARARHEDQLLRLRRALIRVLAELAGVRLIARDEQQRTRRDRLDVVERVKVREFDVAGKRRVRCQFRRRPFGVNSPRGVR